MPAGRFSRYEFAKVYEDDEGRKYFEVPRPLPKTMRDDDQSKVVGEGDRLDTLAWQFFREVRNPNPNREVRPTGFWWVIADLNDIITLEEVAASTFADGRTIFAPSPESLFQDILSPPEFFQRNSSS